MSNFGPEMHNDIAFNNLFNQVIIPQTIQFFSTNDKLMAFAKFKNLADAVRVLVIFHNFNINGK